MKNLKTIEGADLFCGAGGTSTGMLKAGQDLGLEINLLAVNHWPVAVNSHTLNHPGVRHRCESLDTVRPSEAVPGRRLHVMAASPECLGHSLAAGGRPKNDQSRATAWHICRWASELTVDNLFIENVREFMDWGPLDRRHKPIKSRKGETFRAFIQALCSMGYRVEHRIQCSAAFGDPTSRRRLIILARRDGREIIWPEESHGPGLAPYRTAREIIDWEYPSKSIFGRKKPLSANTMRRIAAGLRKFGGEAAEPFLVMLYGTNDARSVDRPLPTVTANGNHIGLVEPLARNKRFYCLNCSRAFGVNDYQSNTVTCPQCGETSFDKIQDALDGCEPFLVPFHSGDGRRDRRAHSVDEPLRTLDTQNRFGLCEPFLIHTCHEGGERCHSVDNPIPTVTGGHRGEMALIEPLLLGQHGGAAARPVSQPVPTVTGDGAIGLIEPFLIQTDQTGGNGDYCRPLDKPIGTVVSKQNVALVQPFLTKYYGTATAVSVDDPLDTVTTKDRFLLVEPKACGYRLDIRFRMLQPHELGPAMGFPKGYKFYGNKGQQTKQIGNAVSVELARAHMRALLSN